MDHIKIAKVPSTLLYRANEPLVVGTLHITTHHLLFTADFGDSETWVSFALINALERRAPSLRAMPDVDGSTTPSRLFYPIIVRGRNSLHWVLFLPSEKEAADVFDSVQKLSCNGLHDRLLAFAYKPFPNFATRDGWTVYDPAREFARMGIGTKTDAWRLTTVNKDYTLCPTYPSVFVVPSRISDNVLNYAAKFRSKGRVPALCYLHHTNLASITRCSQPMVGLKQARSIQDEKLIEAIFASNAAPGGTYGSTSANLIVDARPTANALANVAKGAGTENMENYKNCKKIYLGIDNIHVMRESLARVLEALETGAYTGFVNKAQLARSGWLKHIRSLLEGAALIVKHVHVYSSHVLVHCSDGWDRTSQLVSLAEICLDPYYRTIEGFQVLIEKDWVSFGHKFCDRLGHVAGERLFLMNVSQALQGETSPSASFTSAERSEDAVANAAPSGNAFSTATAAAGAFADAMQQRLGGVRAAASGSLGSLGVSVGSVSVGGPGTITFGSSKEMSPVFHQFLDAVFQIWSQFPSRFEFDDRLLSALHTHSYSCQFGNFLYNTERERVLARVTSRTYSVWDLINSRVVEFRNPAYRHEEDAGEEGGVLMPDPANMRYCGALFSRDDSELNGPAALGDLDQRACSGGSIALPERLPAAAHSGSTTTLELHAPSDPGSPAERRRPTGDFKDQYGPPQPEAKSSNPPAPDDRHPLAVADLTRDLLDTSLADRPSPPGSPFAGRDRSAGAVRQSPASPAAEKTPATPHDDSPGADDRLCPPASPRSQQPVSTRPESMTLEELPHPLYVRD